MTDVGKVSIGVEIHADNAEAKLAEAIRRAVLPAIEDLNRKLTEANRNADQLDRSGFGRIAESARNASVGSPGTELEFAL